MDSDEYRASMEEDFEGQDFDEAIEDWWRGRIERLKKMSDAALVQELASIIAAQGKKKKPSAYREEVEAELKRRLNKPPREIVRTVEPLFHRERPYCEVHHHHHPRPWPTPEPKKKRWIYRLQSKSSEVSAGPMKMC